MAGFVLIVVWLALVVFGVLTGWLLYTKAGQPGWAIFIPIYNIYCLLKIAGKPGWWLLLLLVPLVNFVVAILIPFGVAKNFGQSTAFGFGLLFLGFIFYPILAFGDAQYVGETSY